MLPQSMQITQSVSTMRCHSIAACPIGHPATVRPSSLCKPNQQQQLRSSYNTCTRSWNSNHHIIIPAMQWAAASLPSQADSLSNTAVDSGNISSTMPDGHTVFNYRDGTDSSTAISSRSNAGVISVASPPAPGQTGAAVADTDDSGKPATQEETDKHVKQFNWNKVCLLLNQTAASCQHIALWRTALALCLASSCLMIHQSICSPQTSDDVMQSKTPTQHCTSGWQRYETNNALPEAAAVYHSVMLTMQQLSSRTILKISAYWTGFVGLVSCSCLRASRFLQAYPYSIAGPGSRAVA